MSNSPLELLIKSRTKDLGGFQVRRVLPYMRKRMVGPWIFFDHMGPAEFAPGHGIDVRPHPHINLATVTYLFEGEIFHRDSLGNAGAIVPGDINLMVAGRGIVHSERTRPEILEAGQKLHGLQLWMALPEAHEETEPAFTHYAASDIPAFDVEEVPVRLMMGQAWGEISPVACFSETLYVEARLHAGQSLRLPEASERAVYVASGRLAIVGQEVPEYSMAVLSADPDVEVVALEDSFIALVGGRPLGKRHIDWNFVSSRPERIEQAKQDWKAGRFPVVPGDESESIPLPE